MMTKVEMTASTALKPLSTGLIRASAGLNLCHENADELYNQRPELDFIQIHPEHIIQEEGGTYREQLDALRHHYNVILHGFGLSIGSSAPLDRDYLLLVRDLLEEHRSKMDMMAEALMQYETIDSEQIDAIMEGRKPNPPSDWSDGPSDSPSDPEASSPNDDAMGDPVTH